MSGTSRAAVASLVLLASCSRHEPAQGEGTIDASSASTDGVLEDLSLLAKPTWPAPPPARDGAPVVLRAVRTNGHVVLWGYGGVEGMKGLAVRSRFVDEAGSVVADHASSFPVTPATGSWYRVGFADPHEGVRFARVRAQVDEVLSLGGRALWKPDPGYHWTREWRYPWPSAAPAKLDGAPVAMTVLGKDLLVGKDIFGTPHGPAPRVELTVGVYSLADVPLTRIDFEVEILDRQEVVGTASSVWLPRFGDDAILTFPPRTWSQVTGEAHGATPERLMAANTYRFKVKKIEGPGGVDIPLK